MLERLHLGIGRHTKNACKAIYWGEMNNDIATVVSEGTTCIKSQSNNNPREPEHPVPGAVL